MILDTIAGLFIFIQAQKMHFYLFECRKSPEIIQKRDSLREKQEKVYF